MQLTDLELYTCKLRYDGRYTKHMATDKSADG